MRATVEFTHLKGERIAKGAKHPRGIVAGHVQAYSLGQSRSLVVNLRKSASHGDDIAQLYGVRLVGIGPEVIRLAGLERCGKAWVHQEWVCTVTSGH